MLSLLAPSLNLDPWAPEQPFSVKPDKKVSVRDVMAIHRDVYEGTPFDQTTNPLAALDWEESAAKQRIDREIADHTRAEELKTLVTEQYGKRRSELEMSQKKSQADLREHR